MAFMNWNSTFSVNILEIDNQHKKLVAMINELSEAMKARKGSEVMGKIISGLVDYTKTHFAAEEAYFAKYGYPETAAHKLEHTKFINQLNKFKQDFEAGKLSVTIDVLKFLSDWLVNHIKGTDQKYSKFLNDKGVK